jgi:predicted small lipoprotein YifL
MFARIVVTLLAALALPMLAGCGQKGPLTLPPKAEVPPPPQTVPADPAAASATPPDTAKKK